jgi:hypothetical protein
MGMILFWGDGNRQSDVDKVKSVAQFFDKDEAPDEVAADLRKAWGKLMLNVGLNRPLPYSIAITAALERWVGQRDHGSGFERGMSIGKKNVRLTPRLDYGPYFGWLKPLGKPSMLQDLVAKRTAKSNCLPHVWLWEKARAVFPSIIMLYDK